MPDNRNSEPVERPTVTGPATREGASDPCLAGAYPGFAIPPSPRRFPVSARRINVGVTEPCPCCGLLVRHVPLGHDTPVHHPDKLMRYMRVPLEDRLSRRVDVAA